jgi:hypothetical protein
VAALLEVLLFIVPGFPMGLTPELLLSPGSGNVLLLLGALFSTTVGFCANKILQKPVINKAIIIFFIK